MLKQKGLKIMIKVEKESKDFLHIPLEYCFFCDKPTQFWADAGTIPCCPDCAEKYDVKDLIKRK